MSPIESLTPSISSAAARRVLGLIAVLQVIFALGFSYGPIFEPHDEIEHYRFIRYIAESGALPAADSRMHSQYHQAPLYYMLMSPLARLLPDVTANEVAGPYFNPNQRLAVVGNDNGNIFAHSRAEDFPYSASPRALAVHGLRLASVVMGTVALFGTFTLGGLLWPQRRDRQLIMTAFAAFWPVALGMNGAINNDALLIPLSVWTVVQALRLYLAPSRRGAGILGLLLGAALLTKVFAVILIAPIGVLFLAKRRLWRHAPLVIAAALAVCGWWYLHMTLQYGDPLATRAILQTWPDDVLVTDDPPLLHGLSMTHTQAYARLWARLGHGSIGVDQWLYTAFDFALFAAWIGGLWALFRAIRKKNPPHIPTLAVMAWVLANYALIVYFAATRTYGAQGRYMLMTVPGIAALMTLGFDTLLRRAPVWQKTLALTALPAVAAALVLFGYFLPAYRALPVPDEIAHPLNIRYSDSAELVGMSPADLSAQSGETFTIMLYWRALSPAPVTLQVYLHGIGGEAFLWRDSLPGNGHRRADEWVAGEMWAERYTVEIPADIASGTQIPLDVGLFDVAAGQALPAHFNGSATPDYPVIGTLVIE